MDVTIFYNPPGGPPHCHAPSFLETARGDLLAAWYMYPRDEHQDAKLALAARKKNTADWHTSELPVSVNNCSLGNPVLYQEPGGRICLLFVALHGAYWNDALLFRSCSLDQGQSWSKPEPIWPERGTMVRHPPVFTARGDLLLPAYDENASASLLLMSPPPRYDQWHLAHRFDGLPIIQPVLLRENPGRLFMFFRPADEPRYIWRSLSNNDGSSWSTPASLPLPCPLSGIGAFIAKNKLAVVHNYTDKYERFPLSISLSGNGGVTWEPPWHIDQIQHEISYPYFTPGANGIIHGVYSYNRKMIKYLAIPENRVLAAHA